MIGKAVSHYKILEKIGEGGMGIVYKAQDTKLDRIVALKFLPPYLASDLHEKERFFHEAKAASALNHNNITTIHEIDEYEGQVYIVMEYVEGKILKQIVESETITLKKVLDLAIQIGEGLLAAHEKQIVHRDIKSDNIKVTPKSQVKIMDFGLAKLKGATKLTKAGTTLGTAAYMSPEQAQGEEVDQRSDIFSFGVVLYELLTGRLPFQGEHQAAIIYSILNEEPQPVARFNNQVSVKLQDVVSKALAKDRGERYQHIDDLLADLRREKKSLEYVKSVSAGPILQPKRKFTKGKVLATGVGITVLILGILFVSRLFLGSRPEQITSPRKMVAVLPFVNLGSPEHEYFADGITEEITARLANIQKLGVIARTSVMQYKNTNKTVQQIGSELAVDYILEGTIRWQQVSSGKSRVRVTPQLIRVKDATHLWADVYDEDMAEVFQVQSDIAKKVTQSLDLALVETEQKSLETKPTENLEAYSYYLRGNAYFNRAGAQDRRIAREMYLKAIELDPSFALAHARLCMAWTEIYWHHEQNKKYLEQAKKAVEKAFQLHPNLPEAHMALGSYYYHDHQYEKALEEFGIAQKSLPNSAGLLAEIGFVQRRQGKFEEALNTFRKTALLDPLSSYSLGQLGDTYLRLRNYSEAEKYYKRVLEMDPDVGYPYYYIALLYLNWEGNTAKARQVLADAVGKVAPIQIAGTWAWLEILDGNHQKALEKLSGPEVYEDDTAFYYLNKAQVYGLLQNPQLERAYYDSARIYLEGKPRGIAFVFGFSRAGLGIAYAGLGKKTEALQEAKKIVDSSPVSKDAYYGADLLTGLAQMYLMVGEYESALDQLEYLLSIPSEVSAPSLRLDPTWAPLRKHPRFQKLIDKYTKTKI